MLKLELQLEVRDYKFYKLSTTNRVSTNSILDSISPNGHLGSYSKKKKKGGENGITVGPIVD